MPDAFSLAERIRILAASNCTISEISMRLRFAPIVFDRLLQQEPALAVELVEGQSEGMRLIRTTRDV